MDGSEKSDHSGHCSLQYDVAISYPVIPLLQQLGVAVSQVPVRDQINLIAGNPLNRR
jgi:hypothetical protein